MIAVDTVGAQLQQKLGARAMLDAQLLEARARMAQHARRAELLEQVVAACSALRTGFEERFNGAVGGVISQGLSGIWPGLAMAVEMTEHGDNPVAKFSLVHPRGLETDVEDSGGGRMAVASFLCQVLVHLSVRPRLGRFLALDETFSNVSVEYVPTLMELLRRICQEGGFQILLSTHRPDLMDAGDAAYRFRLEDDGGDGKTVARLRSWELDATPAEG